MVFIVVWNYFVCFKSTMFCLATRNKQLENPLPHSTQWAECTLVHSKYPEYSPNTWREQEILHTSYSNKPNWYVLQVSSLITAVGAKFDCLYQIGTNKNPWTYYLLLKYPCSVKIPPLLQLSLFFLSEGQMPTLLSEDLSFPCSVWAVLPSVWQTEDFWLCSPYTHLSDEPFTIF